MRSDPRDVALKLIDQLIAVTGLSRSGLAGKAKIAPSTVTKHYEEGETTTPSTVTLVKLADAADHKLAVVPIADNERRPRPDPELLRLAMIVALRYVPEDGSDKVLELSRIASLAYDALADEVLKMGRPFADDAAALSFGETLMRGYEAGRRQA